MASKETGNTEPFFLRSYYSLVFGIGNIGNAKTSSATEENSSPIAMSTTFAIK
jgi:hypothetical protein